MQTGTCSVCQDTEPVFLEQPAKPRRNPVRRFPSDSQRLLQFRQRFKPWRNTVTARSEKYINAAFNIRGKIVYESYNPSFGKWFEKFGKDSGAAAVDTDDTDQQDDDDDDEQPIATSMSRNILEEELSSGEEKKDDNGDDDYEKVEEKKQKKTADKKEKDLEKRIDDDMDRHKNDFEFVRQEDKEAEVQDHNDYNEDSDDDDSSSSSDNDDLGVCCFCGDDCNPSSQACGRCARQSFFKRVKIR